ncbi:MAG: cytochrome c [Chitinophagales bacterium]|nr:cytochrome c [Chitinophagales bacterium]
MVLLAIVAAACGGGKKETVPPSTTATPPTYPDAYPLPINELRADRGKTLFQSKCTTCHDLDRKVIGPPLRGVTQRRTYNWMMNMILYPDRWVKTDSVAKALHKEYNYVQMIIPGGITEDQAMAVIAYLQREDAQSMSQP